MILTIDKKIKNFITSNSLNRKYNFSTKDSYFEFVFLCGKKVEKGDYGNRKIIENIINRSDKLTLLAEDFANALKDLNFDLLSFEEILLEISTAVVILLESEGSICELGAFSIIDKNLNKVYVINDKEFENPLHIKEKTSFITEGPVQKIIDFNKASSKKHVYYEYFDDKKVLIPSNELKLNLIADISKETIVQPYKNNSDNPNQIDVYELDFLFWLLLDYIKLFGFLPKSKEYETICFLLNCDSFNIILKSGNKITDTNKVKLIVDLLLKIAEKFGIASIFSLKPNENYWVMNYQQLLDKGININKKASMIFKKEFIASKIFRKFKYKLFCEIKKEGLNIWGN